MTVQCVYIYIYTHTHTHTYIYEMFLHTKMYLSRFKTISMFHTYDTRNKIHLFQVITPNYLKSIQHTTACLFITNILIKLKVLHV